MSNSKAKSERKQRRYHYLAAYAGLFSPEDCEAVKDQALGSPPPNSVCYIDRELDIQRMREAEDRMAKPTIFSGQFESNRRKH